MELVFVTNNHNKFREINNLLGDHFHLKSLEDIGFREDIPEIYPTLEQNASAKSFYIYNRYFVNCFADDTGLEVESLNNQPGVFSARFAELDVKTVFSSKEEQSEANIRKLLRLLKDKDSGKARFRTVISLIIDGREKQFEGIVNGRIINEKRGAEGFGYDPVFIPSGHEQTFAEMDLVAKNKLSHRAIAFRKLVNYLKEL